MPKISQADVKELRATVHRLFDGDITPTECHEKVEFISGKSPELFIETDNAIEYRT